MERSLYSNQKIRFLLFVILFIGIYQSANAHVAVVELENMSAKDTVSLYIKFGFQHIIPLGIDHILFVLSLFLLNPKLKPVLIQATVFTVAHTVTLGLSMYQVINPPSDIVEPIIALSIMYVAMENIISPNLKPSRIGIVFLFGLIHGMGFASVLRKCHILVLPGQHFRYIHGKRISELVIFRVLPRGTWAPGGRNTIECSIEAGCVLRGLLPGREEDELGLAFTHIRISDAAAAGDHESVIEITYRCPLTPWLSVQPDVQYIIQPGGTGALENALVAGLRTTIEF